LPFCIHRIACHTVETKRIAFANVTYQLLCHDLSKLSRIATPRLDLNNRPAQTTQNAPTSAAASSTIEDQSGMRHVQRLLPFHVLWGCPGAALIMLLNNRCTTLACPPNPLSRSTCRTLQARHKQYEPAHAYICGCAYFDCCASACTWLSCVSCTSAQAVRTGLMLALVRWVVLNSATHWACSTVRVPWWGQVHCHHVPMQLYCRTFHGN
jgi:hypothetical protein